MEIEVNIKKKKNSWIALCKQFKTFGYSEVSREDAIKDFEEAIKLFFEVHIERDTLKKLIKIK